MENQIFEVVEIEGKNLGCVALKDVKKGTLILREKPQFSDIYDSESDKNWNKELFMRLLQNFQTMNPNDRAEYLKLSNKFDELQTSEKYLKLSNRHTFDKLHRWLQTRVSEVTREDISGCDPSILDFLFRIQGIYETNKFKGGVGIQASRLVACPQLWSCIHK